MDNHTFWPNNKYCLCTFSKNDWHEPNKQFMCGVYFWKTENAQWINPTFSVIIVQSSCIVFLLKKMYWIEVDPYFTQFVSHDFSGHVAERMNLRYFLSGGMILSAIFTVLFGMGYFWNVHFFTFFLAIQVNIPSISMNTMPVVSVLMKILLVCQ